MIDNHDQSLTPIIQETQTKIIILNLEQIQEQEAVQEIPNQSIVTSIPVTYCSIRKIYKAKICFKAPIQVDKELDLIKQKQNQDKFEEGDPITILHSKEGSQTNKAREIIIQTEDPRDQMIESLLKNNIEIRQQMEEISSFTVNVIQKLKIRHHQEEQKIEKDPELEIVEIEVDKSHHQCLMLKDQLRKLNERFDRLTNAEKINEFSNATTDNQRQIAFLNDKIKGLESMIQKQNALKDQPNPVKDQIQLEEGQLKAQIKLMKKRFRQLDKSNREEIKINQQDFGNIYNAAKQIERLKTHLTLIKTNRTIISNNSQPNLSNNHNTAAYNSSTNNQQQNRESTNQTNLNIIKQATTTNRNEQNLDFSKLIGLENQGLSQVENDIQKNKKLIQFKKKMLENETKMYNQKLKQQENQYSKSLKSIQDAEEIILLKNQENQSLAEELKQLQNVIDPDLLKIFMQNVAQPNLTERPGMQQQSLNSNSGGLALVRSYANLSAKKKLTSNEDNQYERMKRQIQQEKTINNTNKNGSKINQSLKLDSFTEEFRSSTEQTSATTIPKNNQQIYKSMQVGKRLQNLKQLQKEERKSNNTTNNNQSGRVQERSRSINNNYNQNHIQANPQSQFRNQRFRNILNNNHDESFEEAKHLDVDNEAISQLRSNLIQHRIGVNQNRELLDIPERIVLNDKVHGLVQIGKHIQ
eukprot:403344390